MSLKASRWFASVLFVGGAMLAGQSVGRAAQIDQIKKIQAPDGAGGEQFGLSVTIDGSDCLVGAPERDEGGVFASGASYFYGDNLGGVDNWGFGVKRIESSLGSANRLGYSVAMANGFSAIGVWGDDDSGISSGSAYLYERNLGGLGAWGMNKKLVASDAAMDDNFGWAVDIAPDVVIVGARLKNDSRGSAYIYQRNFGGADNWGESKILVAPDAIPASLFGNSVAVGGGIAVVGAPLRDEVGTQSGAVYVYEELPAGAPAARSGTWKFVKKLTPPDISAFDTFGWSVAIDNGSIIVGALQNDSGTGDMGSVYIFHRNQGGPGAYGLVKQLDNPDNDGASDGYARSVDLDGDIALVGAMTAGPAGASIGAVYVHQRNIGGVDNWGLLGKIQASDGANNDWFGYDVAIDADEIIVGSYLDDDLGVDSGSAYIFRINSICPEDFNGDGVVDTADLGTIIANFGGPGPAGDLNGDGVVDTADLGLLISSFGTTGCAFTP